MKNVLVAFLTLQAILLLIVEPGQSFSFDDALNQFRPCLNYVIGQGGDTPSSECCKGVSALKSLTPTVDDRRAACVLLKSLAAFLPPSKDDKTNSLFKKCGVTEPFSFSKDINCETIP
ncbi:PREDICTED: non-specific lipid-transfer protein A-like [Lupinus angustifolius]|uniref:non-specific lipid-transfer protein A-like n=1 Tax=Lupinus angustifolius TaxID=3871 RepID=UPI00092ECC84|nr:PREDICTED: non-specific lipid-transfer protein A-like [Lupinus angustifolius]